jgi:glycosyltransferase involved in cell wall biosynthesis
MRVLLMHRSLGAGGIEAFVCGLANELAKHVDVTVCTIFKPNPTDLFYSRLSDSVAKESINKVGGSINPLKTIISIFRFIRKGNYDVVHLHGFFYFYSLAIILLHKRTRFFYSIHSDALKENNPWDLRLLALKRFCFKKKWARPATISKTSKNSFTQLYHCESELINNGIPKPSVTGRPVMNKYRITPDTKVFIHAGRICPEKNQVMLCKVFNRLIKDGFDVSLVIAGPMHVRSVMDAIEPYLSERIMYIGEQSDIPSMMNNSFGMCLTSFYEGLPIVLLEALATGCVPVCTPVGGITDVVIDGINGFLSTSVSEEDYFQTMKRALQMPDTQVKALRERCFGSFKDYDISITAEKYMDYYKRG